MLEPRGLISVYNILQISRSTTPLLPAPWTAQTPSVCYYLCKYDKNIDSHQRIQIAFQDLKHRSYTESKLVYTDASKTDQGVSAAFYSNDFEFSVKLNPILSICNAELTAILYAIQFMVSSSTSSVSSNFTICSDSLSALQSLQNVHSLSPLAAAIRKLMSEHQNAFSLNFMWVPSHVGIPGNEAADRLAKAALSVSTPSLNEVPIQDCKNLMRHKIRSSWNNEWSTLTGNKLKEIKPENKPWETSPPLSRRNQVTITRLRIGHTNATHVYLMKRQEAPICNVCNCRVTVKHLLENCTKYQNIRSPNDLYSCLSSDPSPILTFIVKAHLKI
uniref:RNase H type-1 domain-containing protein n=1 Tax=Cacopsylla melanoneura TaxID=428564 RepID=A0A8D8YDS6_9HEMI